MSDECRFDAYGKCEAHRPDGLRSDPALCTHAAAALQGRVEQLGEDLRVARTTYGAAYTQGLEARVRELEGQLKQREQEMQQHIMTHAEALSEMGAKVQARSRSWQELEAHHNAAVRVLSRLGLVEHAGTWITREEADRISKDGP